MEEGINVLSLFDGKYAVTRSGDIYSNVGTRKKLVGKITKHGYHMLVLTVNGKKLYKNAHRLVAENFIPNPQSLPEVNHKDGNKTNNHVANLEWCSSSHNQLHAYHIGLQKGKVDLEVALKIREAYATGNYSHRELEHLFPLKKTQIGQIINNKSWSVECV